MAGAVSLLTFVVYLSSLRNGFVEWDDDIYVFENPHIRSFDSAFFKWAFGTFHAANWHPLTWISHALDYAIWGLNPIGHHLTNNILHAVNTFLVVLLVVRLIEAVVVHSQFTIHDSSASADPPGAGASRFTLTAAAVTGLLFGLHPIHVESVAWVAERKDLLCALFFLLSVMAYTKYVTDTLQGAKDTVHSSKMPIAESRKQRTVFPMLHELWAMRYALCFFVLALLSKPMAVSLPVVLLILDWYPFQRIRSMKTLGISLIEKLPFIALSLGSSILTMLAQKAGRAMEAMEFVPLADRLLVSLKSLIAYLWAMLLPLNLIPFYPYPKDIRVLSLTYLLPVALVTGITIGCLILARKQKLWSAAWGYYVVTLLPVLGIIQVGGQSMADRYTYLPSLGPFLLAGLIAAGAYEKAASLKKGRLPLRMGSIIAASAVLCSITYITVQQVGIWKNGQTFWEYVIEKEPLKVPHAYNNLGYALLEKGQTEEAARLFETAISLAPAYAEAHNNLCIAYKAKGLYDKALEECLAAVRLSPNDPVNHNNLGIVYKHKGLYDKALEQHQIAINLKPDYAAAYFNLGNIYLEKGDMYMARRSFEAGLRIRPDDEKARQVLNNIISK